MALQCSMEEKNESDHDIYIQEMLLYMVIAFPFYLTGRFIFIKKTKKKIKLLNEAILAIFALYLVGLASQTIIPRFNMATDSNTGEFLFEIYLSNENAEVNLIPFYTLYQYFFTYNENISDWESLSLLNITANMLLFLPIGFFVPLIWKRWNSFKKIFWLGFSVTCLIEMIQFFIGRSPDIDDVILNTLSVSMGYGIFLLSKKIFVNRRHQEPRLQLNRKRTKKNIIDV